MARIKLQGKILIKGEIKALTGLHIGGSGGELEIGGVDNPVIRNPYNNEPYIPGSTLRGKMRSLLDRQYGNDLNKNVGKRSSPVRIHECDNLTSYKSCSVCQVFGVAPSGTFTDAMPARLIVRDVYLTDDTVKKLEEIDTDMPFTEVKTEVAIDRITSAATPRQNERVPAGAIFGPFEMVYSLYVLNLDNQGQEIQRELKYFATVLEGMELLEDDSIGGHGSRGSGKIEFSNMQMVFRTPKYYRGEEEQIELATNTTVESMRKLDYKTPILQALS